MTIPGIPRWTERPSWWRFCLPVVDWLADVSAVGPNAAASIWRAPRRAAVTSGRRWAWRWGLGPGCSFALRSTPLALPTLSTLSRSLGPALGRSLSRAVWWARSEANRGTLSGTLLLCSWLAMRRPLEDRLSAVGVEDSDWKMTFPVWQAHQQLFTYRKVVRLEPYTHLVGSEGSEFRVVAIQVVPFERRLHGFRASAATAIFISMHSS
mmetsp:Transcript_84064/g.154204  ORF Transcript_84064/g.154204 Transcript_84064/m.154204 type:complete len:209 (-) Transcript_84064:7-633(-)